MTTPSAVDVSIRYFEESHRAAKYNRLNPHTRSAAETLEIVRPHFADIGLSRLVDLTAQDRVGLPVFNAIKPDMVNYSVQHGKGVTREAARLSAVMETFERHYAAVSSPPFFSATYRQAAREHAIIPFERLARARASIFTRDTVIDWTTGFDIVHNEPVAIPLDLVRIRTNVRRRKLPLLQVSTNGLASATSFPEAVCQGLLEVIERDAITCHNHRSRARGRSLPVDPINWRSITHSVIRPLLDRMYQADLIPMLFSCETDIGIPTYNCFIADRRNPDEGFYHGMGAGMDEATAMVRAITEAIQGRAVIRAGLRDSFFHSDNYFHTRSNPMALISRCGGEHTGREMNTFADYSTDSFEEDIRTCIEKLSAVGLDQVLVVRLTPKEHEIVVVRVVVPGLEGYILSNYLPGKRALAVLEEEKR